MFLVSAGGVSILVDSGSPSDWDALIAALAAENLTPADLGLLVLTHAHADHAGLAARLQREHVLVVLGERDVSMASRGHDDALHTTSALGEGGASVHGRSLRAFHARHRGP